MALDWIGTIVSLGMTVSLLLALQWGGVQYPWNHRIIIALFILVRKCDPSNSGDLSTSSQSGVLFILLVWWERRLGARAMMPLSILTSRTQVRLTCLLSEHSPAHSLRSLAQCWVRYFQHHACIDFAYVLRPLLLPSPWKNCRTEWNRYHSAHDGYGSWLGGRRVAEQCYRKIRAIHDCWTYSLRHCWRFTLHHR